MCYLEFSPPLLRWSFPVLTPVHRLVLQEEEGANNKRSREDDGDADGEDGPEKKRASSAMLAGGLQGGDADPPAGYGGMPGGVDPSGAGAGAEVSSSS